MSVLIALIAVPALGAVGAGVRRAEAYRTAWLVTVGVVHAGLLAVCWASPPPPLPGGWLALDAIGRTALTAVSLVFLAVAVSTVGYLRRENPRGGRLFVSCLLAFLSASSLVAASHHLGLLWVGMEATTLSVAPLIYHRHDRRSLEAVWKYLVLSSVGIAFALLGTFLLAAAQSAGAATGRPLVVDDLVAAGDRLQPGWVRGAFIFLLVGYGTKMGLAPLHNWKPDTYGEAPSLVSGLMAGALTTTAFVGLARATQVVLAAGQGAFARPLLIGFGLVSLLVAAAFLVRQSDLKRLLAYSSVEQQGLLALGLGLGGVGAYGTVLHAVNNALAKGLLFLVVGNVALASGTAAVAANRGVLRRLPVSGSLLLIGLFAVAGSPPFGPFVSEFTIVRAAVGGGQVWVAPAMAALMLVTFVGMARTFLDVAYGAPAPGEGPVRESPWLLAGPLGLATILLLLGLYVPAPLQRTLAEAAALLGGSVP